MVHIRRLVKAGQTSHTVSLPKEWLEKNNLKKGDTIYVHDRNDSELLITPHLLQNSPQEKKEITISSDKKTIDTIQRELASAYINNYHIINIAGEGVSSYVRELREIIQSFAALEIVEQSSKRITVKDILNLDDVSIDKTIKRMDMVVRSMLQDAVIILEKPDLDESMSFRDEDVNRIYFLLFRLLKSALKNQKVAEKFGLSNEKLLSAWYLAVNVENTADCCKNMSALLKKAKKEEANNVVAVLKELEKNYLEAMRAYYTSDKNLADCVAKQRVNLLRQIDKIPPQYSENLKLMTTVIGNIARTVIDEE